jgi:hypothetical protein
MLIVRADHHIVDSIELFEESFETPCKVGANVCVENACRSFSLKTYGETKMRKGAEPEFLRLCDSAVPFGAIWRIIQIFQVQYFCSGF